MTWAGDPPAGPTTEDLSFDSMTGRGNVERAVVEPDGRIAFERPRYTAWPDVAGILTRKASLGGVAIDRPGSCTGKRRRSSGLTPILTRGHI